jgi:hypothetical protein
MEPVGKVDETVALLGGGGRFSVTDGIDEKSAPAVIKSGNNLGRDLPLAACAQAALHDDCGFG